MKRPPLPQQPTLAAEPDRVNAHGHHVVLQVHICMLGNTIWVRRRSTLIAKTDEGSNVGPRVRRSGPPLGLVASTEKEVGKSPLRWNNPETPELGRAVGDQVDRWHARREDQLGGFDGKCGFEHVLITGERMSSAITAE